MENKSHCNIILFFTSNVSLQNWVKNGRLDREIAIYQEYIKNGWNVSFITYGNQKDQLYQDQLGAIKILCNKWNLPQELYTQFLHYIHAKFLAEASIIKTNQILGADTALRVARYWHKPIVARCGYLWTSDRETSKLDKANSEEELNETREIEEVVFKFSQNVIVTTQSIKRYIEQTYRLPEEKLNVIPNYVQTDVFLPKDARKFHNRICCIGRLSEQKNYINLIKACEGLDVELDIVGSGPLKDEMSELASKLKVKVNFLGNVPNSRLPDIV